MGPDYLPDFLSLIASAGLVGLTKQTMKQCHLVGPKKFAFSAMTLVPQDNFPQKYGQPDPFSLEKATKDWPPLPWYCGQDVDGALLYMWEDWIEPGGAIHPEPTIRHQWIISAQKCVCRWECPLMAAPLYQSHQLVQILME